MSGTVFATQEFNSNIFTNGLSVKSIEISQIPSNVTPVIFNTVEEYEEFMSRPNLCDY